MYELHKQLDEKYLKDGEESLLVDHTYHKEGKYHYSIFNKEKNERRSIFFTDIKELL